MVVIANPSSYRLVGFEVNHGNKHKYNAILENKQTHRQKKVPFGGKKEDGTPYQHYRDRIGHYSKYDHLDKDRRQRYRIRHHGQDKHKFSSGFFSWRFLW